MRYALAAAMLVIVGGCSGNRLETGYAFTPVGDTPAQRRGYYADPFSPEARAAQQQRDLEAGPRRVIPGE